MFEGPMYDPKNDSRRLLIMEKEQKDAIEQARVKKIRALRNTGNPEDVYRAAMIEEFGE